ncbi:MAG: amidohydrolase family protein [Lachnospiraceae bacterium]
MGKSSYVLKGNVCYSKDQNTIVTYENQYLICVDGISMGVFEKIPDIYTGLKVVDYTDKLIIPGLSDLHTHAPQYAFRGLGMDHELLQWLELKTFPEEAKYADIEYAQKAYEIFADDMKTGATTRAAIFATIHVDSTILLMDLLEKTGIRAYVGKVNMDRNAPEYLLETDAEQSIQNTLRWLERCEGRYERIHPIITPRFIPTCTDELMSRLSEIQQQYQLPMQSHLSENQGEIAWVHELCPQAEFYGDAYERTGMFGGDVPTIMAHCVSSEEAEIQRMKERGVYVAHCPQSNSNLSSGIAPVYHYLEQGMNVGLGSDIAGGSSFSILRAMTDAIQVSKLRWRLQSGEGETQKPLTAAQAFYMGTKGGGSFFGKVGSFEAGYEFDAVVLDDSNLRHPQPLSVAERLERLLYLANETHVIHKYVSGESIF